MPAASTYPELDQLFGAYLNQDYAYYGETISEVVAAYCADSSAADLAAMLGDIDRFTTASALDLDASLLAAYGFDFDPALWQLTTASFFDLLRRLVQAASKR